MGLLNLASGNSFWRGYEYYKASMVVSVEQITANRYQGKVRGSGKKAYEVTIDLEHPKKSTCTCPHAEGTRRICKHKVALYFSVFPEEADRALKEAEEWEAEEEKREQERIEEIREYVNSLSKQQLREELIQRMVNEMYGKWY